MTREKSRVQDLLRQTLLSNAQTEGPSRNEESSKTSGDDHFDPNHLLAHVQAVKAVEESDRNEEQAKSVKNGQERTTQKVLDDSEESNTIPISAIPTQVNVNQPKSNEDVGDLGLTVISLQKDARNKQNFKGFVDSDLIDDKSLPFIPTRAPAPPPSPTTTRSTTITTRPATTTSTTTTTTRRTTTAQRTTSVDNQVKVTSNQFIPTSRNTPRPSTAKESTTTPFVRIPFGPFSLNNQKDSPPSESDEPSPKVSVSVSTSLSKSSSSSSSTSSETSTPISASTSSSVSKVN